MSIASAWAIATPIASPISSLQYGKCHWSGDSMTPSNDKNSDAITFLMETSFVRRSRSSARSIRSGTTDEGGLHEKSDRIGVLVRSEEHTSELQSRQYLVCSLLLEQK